MLEEPWLLRTTRTTSRDFRLAVDLALDLIDVPVPCVLSQASSDADNVTTKLFPRHGVDGDVFTPMTIDTSELCQFLWFDIGRDLRCA